jgi:Lar family restriction alleviation protein
MKNRATALKPCPHCGLIEHVGVQAAEPADRNSTIQRYFAVWCNDCGARGPYDDTPEEAAVVWNIRAYS